MDKKYILFDLDGTLTDPKIGITSSVQYSLKHFGIDADCDDLVKFIGPPLRDSFQEFYGFTAAEAETAVAKYREYFSDTGIWENTPYPGMLDALQILKKSGLRLAIATSKPTVFATRIAERFGFLSYFDHIEGSELDSTHSEKIDIIESIRRRLDPEHTMQTIMIGDRRFDIDGARQAGVDSIGVTWGYGSIAELEEARATHIVSTWEELLRIIER